MNNGTSGSKKYPRGLHPNSRANLKKAPLWEKGVSANPGGVPKAVFDVRKVARANAPKAFREIIKVMECEKTAPSLKVRCAEIVLERAFGKALKPLDIEVSQKDTYALSHLEALKLVNREFAIKDREERERARKEADAMLIEAQRNPDVTSSDGSVIDRNK